MSARLGRSVAAMGAAGCLATRAPGDFTGQGVDAEDRQGNLRAARQVPPSRR